MKQRMTGALVVAALSLSLIPRADAARVRVVHRGPRTRTVVTVHTGFPIHRTFPTVVVRTGPVVRVAPRAYLAPVVFGAVVVATLPPPASRPWSEAEMLTRDEGWTDFTMNVDRRGTGLLLDVQRGAAQISFAEIVFENGDTQVVDFNDKVHATGAYTLLDFRDGRKVDHVRVVAQAATGESEIRVHLLA